MIIKPTKSKIDEINNSLPAGISISYDGFVTTREMSRYDGAVRFDVSDEDGRIGFVYVCYRGERHVNTQAHLREDYNTTIGQPLVNTVGDGLGDEPVISTTIKTGHPPITGDVSLGGDFHITPQYHPDIEFNLRKADWRLKDEYYPLSKPTPLYTSPTGDVIYLAESYDMVVVNTGEHLSYYRLTDVNYKDYEAACADLMAYWRDSGDTFHRAILPFLI